MQQLKRILVATAAFLLLMLVIGFMLPSAWQTERSVLIHAPASTIFPYLNSLKQWREWTIWYRRQPDLQTEYSGAEAGLGATSRWRDENGRAVMKVMQSERNRLVGYTTLINGGDFRVEGVLTLVPEGEATRVVWKATGDAGHNLADRYLALFEGLRIGGEFADSLELLKQKLEPKS